MHAYVCVAAYAGTQTRTGLCVCVCVCIDASMHTHPCVSCQKLVVPAVAEPLRRVCVCLRQTAELMDGWNVANVSFRRSHGRAKGCRAFVAPLIANQSALGAPIGVLRPNPNPYALIGLANNITSRPIRLGDGTKALWQRSSSVRTERSLSLAVADAVAICGCLHRRACCRA